MGQIGRRRLLAVLAGSVTLPVSGCLQLGDDTDSTEAETDDPDRSGEQTQTAPEELLAFGDDVGPDIRDRATRALERTSEILDAQLEAPLTIELMDASPLRPSSEPGSFESIIDLAAHQEWPPVIIGGNGRYSPGSRTLRIADPNQVADMPRAYPAGLEALQDDHRDDGFDIDLPENPIAGYPSEDFLAHELMHAYQGDIPATPQPSALPPETVDGQFGKTTIIEGAAEFVRYWYLANCRDGSYDPCVTQTWYGSPGNATSWMLRGHLSYWNGAVFTAHLYADGGWEAVWDAHTNPPETAWAGMFPERYLEDGKDVPTWHVDAGPPGWEIVDTSTLGVNVLYEKLALLGRIPQDGMKAVLPAEMRETIAIERMFRTPLLAGWQGDCFVGLAATNDPQETGYYWVIEFETPDGAVDLAGAVREGYRDIGEEAGEFWNVDDGYRAVETDGSLVVLAMGPSQRALNMVLETKVQPNQ